MPGDGEELWELFGGPALGSAALTEPRPRWLSSKGGVCRDEVLPGRLGERRADHDVYGVDGLRSEPRLLHAAGGEEVAVEVVEVLCSHRPNVGLVVVTTSSASAIASRREEIASASSRRCPAGCQRRRSRPVTGSMPS